MLEKHVFGEMRVGTGGAVMRPASPEKLEIVRQAAFQGIDINAFEKIVWKVVIRILTFVPAVLMGFVIGLGILIPVVLWNTIKWHDIFSYSLYRIVLARRLKAKLMAV